MVNNEAFAERIEILLKHYELNAATFADKLDIGRSSISHIMSGRNKPSLDFILKVLHNFPEVDLYWLLNGKGTFPKEDSTEIPIKQPPSPSLFDAEVNENSNFEAKSDEYTKALSNNTEKDIKQIVVFYDDGTFSAFTPE